MNVQKLESMAPEFQTLTDSLKKTSTPASILVDKNGQPSPPKMSRLDAIAERPSPTKHSRLETERSSHTKRNETERPSPPKPARLEVERSSPSKPSKLEADKPGHSARPEDKTKRSSGSHSHHR